MWNWFKGIPSHARAALYLRRAETAKLRWPLPGELSDADLEARLYPPQSGNASRKIPQPDWAYVHAELRRKGVTLALLWQEYREVHPDGYGYSQYCMGKPHPLELRQRVVAHVESGNTHYSAAARFDVSVKFVNDMVRLKRATGSLAPRPQGNGGCRCRYDLGHLFCPEPKAL